jgi:hypothetical protein
MCVCFTKRVCMRVCVCVRACVCMRVCLCVLLRVVEIRRTSAFLTVTTVPYRNMPYNIALMRCKYGLFEKTVSDRSVRCPPYLYGLAVHGLSRATNSKACKPTHSTACMQANKLIQYFVYI